MKSKQEYGYLWLCVHYGTLEEARQARQRIIDHPLTATGVTSWPRSARRHLRVHRILSDPTKDVNPLTEIA